MKMNSTFDPGLIFLTNYNYVIFQIQLHFKSAQYVPVQGETEDGVKTEDLKSSPVRIGGFGMTSHTNKSVL
jgi:hypothetical protein